MHRNAPFRIVIAYENFAAGIRAKDMADRVASQLKPEYEIESDLWKFELLGRPQLGEQASSAASEADMIIISASAAAELPAGVKKWIKSWVPQKRGEMAALVALLDDEEESFGELAPPCAYLRRMAEEGGMDFFCKTGHRQNLDFEYTVETSRRQPERTAVALEEVLHQESRSRGWSINE